MHRYIEVQCKRGTLRLPMQSLVGLPSGMRVWAAAGLTDRRKGFNGLKGHRDV